jgi:hypothetical protein
MISPHTLLSLDFRNRNESAVVTVTATEYGQYWYVVMVMDDNTHDQGGNCLDFLIRTMLWRDR